MPRFFFDSEDGEFYQDKGGSLFPDLPTARTEAVKLFGELLIHHPEMFLETGTFRMIIQDDRDLTLYVLELSGLAAPAAGAAKP